MAPHDGAALTADLGLGGDLRDRARVVVVEHETGLDGTRPVHEQRNRRVGGQAFSIGQAAEIWNRERRHRILTLQSTRSGSRLVARIFNQGQKPSNSATMRPASVGMVKATCLAVYDMDYITSYRYTDACSMALHFGESEWNTQRGFQKPK